MRLFELLNAISTESKQAHELCEDAYSSDAITKLVIQSDRAQRTPQDIEQLIDRAKSDPNFAA